MEIGNYKASDDKLDAPGIYSAPAPRLCTGYVYTP